MKILHTSDWHLGKKLERFSRLEEQQQVLDEIISIANSENVDVVLIAGDLFDTGNPPVEAVELYYKTLIQLSKKGVRPVIAIAGNHDSPERIEAPDPLARECGILFVGHPETVPPVFTLKDTGLAMVKSQSGFAEFFLPGYDYPLRILITPYANEIRLKKCFSPENSEEELRQVLQEKWSATGEEFCNDKGVNILITHLFIVENQDSPVDMETEDEKPILHVGGVQQVYSYNLPAQLQYAALGHLHRAQVVSENPCPIIYSGSPLAYSMSEENQQKYVFIVDVEPGCKALVKKVSLSKGFRLIRKEFEKFDDALFWLKENQDCYIELILHCDSFIKAEERQQLQEAHPRLTNIIPVIKRDGQQQSGENKPPDINSKMEDLFSGFFEQKNGQPPSNEILDIFREITAMQSEESE